MPETLGFAADTQRCFWREALATRTKYALVRETTLGGVLPVGVQVWLVVPDKGDDGMQIGFWLRSLRAPIILVTNYTGTALRLAPTVPKLAFICHPLRAEAELSTLLFLACHWTGGTQVLHAPRSRAVHVGEETTLWK